MLCVFKAISRPYPYVGETALPPIRDPHGLFRVREARRISARNMPNRAVHVLCTVLIWGRLSLSYGGVYRASK